jgi:hypothetical protein
MLYNNTEEDYKLIELSDAMYRAKRHISNADNIDEAIQKFYDARNEYQSFEQSIKDKQDEKRRDNNIEYLIDDEKVTQETYGERYEYKDLFKKSPVLATLQRSKDMYEFTQTDDYKKILKKEGKSDDEIDSKVAKSSNSYKQDIKDLEYYIGLKKHKSKKLAKGGELKEVVKTDKQASLAKTLRTFADGGVIASNIIMQLGGFSRLQIMLGAYNFVDRQNGLSFKIKNAKANYIKITLNGKDLYDIEIGRIRGNTYKVVYSQEDVYAVDLRKIIEKHTGMYMAFEDGGDIHGDVNDVVLEDAYYRDGFTDEETLILSSADKLANGGITAMEVLEAREFVGEKDWVKMKPKERLSATRYLIRTGKIGYYAYAHGGTTKARPTHKSSYTKKYKVKYLIGYSDEEEGLKYHEGFYYADSKDVAALEVFDHLQRQGYTHIEILGISLVADKGMEVQSDEQLMQKYKKLKGNVPDWFRDMPTRYKVEIIDEIEDGYEDEKPEGDEFARGGDISSKRERVVDYYINNEDDETLNDFGVPERALENRDKYYKEIFEKISDQFEDEEIYYKFRELNLDEASEEPEDYAHGGKIEVKIKERLSKSFELPLQMAIYVPSTKDKNIVISKEELSYRVKVVEKYLATLFGGFNSAKVDGGFQSVDKGVINEDAVRVVAFANPEGFEQKFEKLVNKVKEWCRLWSQESIGLEFENDLFYIEQDSKFAKGGKVKDPHPDYPDFVSMKYADGGYDTDDKVNVYVLLKPSQYYYDSDNTTNKKYWFKLNGNPVSREVAKQMADKYLQKYNLPISDRKIGYVRRYGRYEDGGDIEFGEDLGNGFSVGNDVYITDSKSMYKGKTGFVSGLAGKDLLVTISENGNERSIVVSKKGVEMIDAPMADGGMTIAGFPKDYHELNMNFLKIFKEYGFINSIDGGHNTYVNESGDILYWWPKTNHSEGQLRLTFNKTYTNFDMEVLNNFQKKHIDYSIYYESVNYVKWVFFVYLSQGKESNYNTKALIKLFDEFNLPKEQRVGKLSFTPYYAKGGEMDKKPAKFKDKVKAISKSLEGKKVPKRVRKDYGATYDKKESIDAAKRIAGSMAKKERKRYGI